jgi:hypothetical protein
MPSLHPFDLAGGGLRDFFPCSVKSDIVLVVTISFTLQINLFLSFPYVHATRARAYA